MRRQAHFSTETDYYEVLGVRSTATAEEIRTQFRRLVLECHPDKNPGRREWSEKRIRELIIAYEVLGNAGKREAFDRYHRVRRRTMPQEPFFFRRKTPGARALLILHYLLNSRAGDAVELLRDMESVHGDGYLADYLDRNDYLDCLFLLGEHFTAERDYVSAARRLRAFFLEERTSRHPRHYFSEVIRQLKDLYLRKLPRTTNPVTRIRFLGEAEKLALTPQEDLLRLLRLAEAQALAGSLSAARETIVKIQKRDPNAKGLHRIEKLLASGA